MWMTALLMTMSHGTAIILWTAQCLCSNMITNYLFANSSACLLWNKKDQEKNIIAVDFGDIKRMKNDCQSNENLIISNHGRRRWLTLLFEISKLPWLLDNDDVIKRNIELIYLHALISLSLISHTNQSSRVVYYIVPVRWESVICHLPHTHPHFTGSH